jgi:hypothetical protein
MKTTTTQIEKPAVPASGYGIGARRDEAIAAQFIQSALQELLASNVAFDYGNGFVRFDCRLGQEELIDEAEWLGLAAFGRWKAWRKRERAIAALKNNPKAVVR